MTENPTFLPPTEDPEVPVVPNPQRHKGRIIGGIACVVVSAFAIVLAVVAISSDFNVVGKAASAFGPAVTKISRAAEKCGLPENVNDGGHSITLDTEGDEDASGDDFLAVFCITVELDMPDSMLSRIDNTRALDGFQSGEWDNYTASWNYHPDNGLLLIIEDGAR